MKKFMLHYDHTLATIAYDDGETTLGEVLAEADTEALGCVRLGDSITVVYGDAWDYAPIAIRHWQNADELSPALAGRVPLGCYTNWEHYTGNYPARWRQ